VFDEEAQAFDDEDEAFDDEDRAFDFKYRTIDDGFRLQGDEFPLEDCVARTNDDEFGLKLGLFVVIGCVECPKDARERSIEAKFQTIPVVDVCFAVVNGRRGDAFPA
jgi:hypothetical protein